MKIFAFHLLNDYSGSPKVLSQLVKGWITEKHDVTLVTCKGREGFLSNIPGATYIYYPYRWFSNPLLRLLSLCFSQLMLVVRTWRHVDKDDVLYINTVLPFGAALLGRLKGCRVVYHVHETSMKPAILKKFLFGMVKCTASDVVYVSKYLRDNEPVNGVSAHTLYNALENGFYNTAKDNRKQQSERRNVLMLCSLKAYKGVWEFVTLAQRHPNFQFKLVLNATVRDIDSFFKTTEIPANLKLFPTQTNTHPFYAWADVVLNLSRPDGWVETFGLTALEAMAYELPVIVPCVGGITELVENGHNGFQADSRNLEEVSRKLDAILGDEQLYNRMRLGAKLTCMKFSADVMLSESLSLLQKNYISRNEFHKTEFRELRVENKH